MANEISASASLSVTKGGAQASGTAAGTATLTGTELLASVQNFTTANSQQISIGGCDQIQCLMVKNLDTTNNLTVSLDTTHTQVISTIPPGHAGLFYNLAAAPYAKSAAATIDAFIVVCEN